MKSSMRRESSGCRLAIQSAMMSIYDWISSPLGSDEAARKGADNKNDTLKVVRTPIPAIQAKAIRDEAIRKKWKRELTNDPHYKHTKIFL